MNIGINLTVNLQIRNDNNKKTYPKSAFLIQALKYFNNLLNCKVLTKWNLKNIKQQFSYYLIKTKLSLCKIIFDFNLSKSNAKIIINNANKRKYVKYKYYAYNYIRAKNNLQNALKHESNAQINSFFKLLPI